MNHYRSIVIKILAVASFLTLVVLGLSYLSSSPLPFHDAVAHLFGAL